MKVEKKFFTEEAMLWQRAEQLAEEEALNCSGSTAEEEEQKAQDTMDRTFSDRRSNFQVIQKDRHEYFEKISNSAMELAEAIPLDFAAETEQSFGKISLSADRLMLLPSTSPKMKEILATLIREAESTDIQVAENGWIELSFVFSFHSRTSREKHV